MSLIEPYPENEFLFLFQKLNPFLNSVLIREISGQFFLTKIPVSALWPNPLLP